MELSLWVAGGCWSPSRLLWVDSGAASWTPMHRQGKSFQSQAKQTIMISCCFCCVFFLPETNIVAKGQRDTRLLTSTTSCVVVQEWAEDAGGKIQSSARVFRATLQPTRRTDEKNRQQIWRWQLVPERRPSRHRFLLFMPLWLSSCRQSASAGNLYIPRRKSHNTCLPLWLSLVTAEPSASASCNISSWLLHPDSVLWILSDYMHFTLVQYQPLKCPALQGTLLECHLAVAVLFKLYSNVCVAVARQLVHPRLRQLQE